MANIVYPVFCIIFFAFISQGGCQKDIGDLCTIINTGAGGVCKLLSGCAPAVQALQTNGIFPQTCGFQYTQPIVCCVEKGTVVKPPTPTTTTTTTRKPPTISKVGDITRAKCKEYSQYYKTLSPTLVVGGVQVVPKEFPHMALIGFDGENNVKSWQCGGTLISELFILTAAHCLYDQQFGEPKYIRIGELSLSSDDDDADIQDFNIVDKIRHPEYKPPSQYNDIALLKLDRPARLNPYARPACLETIPIVTALHAVATGWGKVGYSDDVSTDLMKVTLEFFTNEQCNDSYKSNIGIRLQNGIIEKSQLCAGSHTLAKDTCQGDSGGPLQIVNREDSYMHTIVGVTSFGKACGVVNIPGVYTRVSNYIGWIESNVWPS